MTCPNCGAPVKGDVCEYCGTVFIDIRKKKNALNQKIFEDYLFLQRSRLIGEALAHIDGCRKEHTYEGYKM